MKIHTQQGEQIKNISFMVLMVWMVYLIITGLIIGLGYWVYNIPVGTFTREPNVTLNGPFYVGAISNLGIILWTAAATLCIFGFIYLRRYNPHSSFLMFLFNAGIFTTLLLLDDVYQWHENMFPVYLHVSQKIIYLIYFSYALFFLIRFRKVIFKTEYIILLTSILLLSLSIIVDIIHDSGRLTILLEKVTGFNMNKSDDLRILLEDTFKGLGILTWLIYFSRVTFLNVFPLQKRIQI